jgi:predicted dehydrogenase
VIIEDGATRVAVVGVGQMGVNHARVLRQLRGADLVGVLDHDPERASVVASQFGTVALPTVDALVDAGVEAVSVCVPSSLHAAVGCELFAAGIHCLIEKPLATTEADALALIAAAEAADRRLLVGHIERFNPAVIQLGEIVRGSADILATDARRMSAVSGRITDVDVVSDLMVHDIDIVLDLVGDEVADVTARGVLRSRASGDDYVSALLTFAGGALASFTASRITQNQIRELQVSTDERLMTVDYSAQELCMYRQGRIGGVGESEPEGSRYVLDVSTERVFVRRTEPLVAELMHFLEVVQGRETPRVPGSAALRALRIVWEIRDQVQGRMAHG